MHLSWLLLLLSSMGAITVLVGTNTVITPKNMLTTTNTTKPGCQRKCGNLTIPYPFGIGQNCYLQGSFGIICNTSYNPPRAFPVIPYSDFDILDITETQIMIRTTIIASRCQNSQGNVTFETGNLDMWGSPFTISNTANKLTVIGCNNYAVFSGSGDTAESYQRTGCISLCSIETEPVPGHCPGLGCCQDSVPFGWQGFTISLFGVEDEQGVNSIARFLSNQSCSYAFYAEKGSFIFGGASDLTLNNFDVVRNRIMKQLNMVLDWNIKLNTSCKMVKMSNSSINPYLCQSNTRCIDTEEGGYRCSCLPGYEGNPYLKPGCTDINECIAGPNNPCTMACVNSPGSYKCSCPRGYTGDGLKSGIGCVRIIDKSSSALNKFTLGLGISLGIIILLIVAWWFSTIIKRRRIIKQKAINFERNGGLLLQQQMAADESVVAAIKIFTVEELERATDHFIEDRILGKGGQGTVYKGMLSEGRIVAIKMCKVIVDQNQCGDFVNEVIILSNINHRNVVKLLGCCLEHEAPLQVFEFIPNGTLDHHIHSPISEFLITWRMRLQIASDLAGALSYLHSSSSIPIFHRDIKSSNILLDDKYRAKLSDFGTSKSVAIDQTHATTRVMGTFGYLDPEYYLLGQYTEKSDVYSFGVVLVELLTGQKAIRSTLEEEKSLTSWFLSHMENSRLLDIIDSQVVKETSKEEFLIIAEIANRCLNLDRNRRPTMKEVLLEIEAVLSLHLPHANEQIEPKSRQMFSETSNGVFFSPSTFYLENSSSSSADVSLLNNPR
ncbi:wall-associated receptor kinase-like 8 [Chenopodium quinoa]|uniref:Uncharacterized protein n=1 Tax=Chenopodium quinoa TaxID=63459 RepID=A0A803L499_CHEQI|nr:wall-associated receptor kinase-like 8 [Chenopodium quinoa]